MDNKPKQFRLSFEEKDKLKEYSDRMSFNYTEYFKFCCLKYPPDEIIKGYKPSTDNSRETTIQCRLNNQERKTFDKFAKRLNMNATEYFKYRCLDHPPNYIFYGYEIKMYNLINFDLKLFETQNTLKKFKRSKKMRNTKVIAMVNKKGGVGKSTSTFNLGYELGRLGYKVLLIDYEGQGNVTMCAGVDDPKSLDRTVADYIVDYVMKQGELPRVYDILIKTEYFDLLPSNKQLESTETMLAMLKNQTKQMKVLSTIIDLYKADYDYIIIDCPATLGTTTLNAIIAADSILIPINADEWAVRAMEDLFETLAEVNEMISKDIVIDGIFMTMTDKRTNMTKDIEDLLTEYYDDIHLMDARIPFSTTVKDANRNALSSSQYAESHKKSNVAGRIAEQYQLLAKEVVKITESERAGE